MKLVFNQNIISYIFGITLLCCSGWCKTTVLVAHSASSPVDFTKALESSKNLISFADLVEAESGAVSRHLIQNTHEAPNSTTQGDLIYQVTSGMLSPLRRNLLIQLLTIRTNLGDSIESTTRTSELEIAALKNEPKFYNGTIKVLLQWMRADDRIYINGFRIDASEVDQLRLHKDVHYHFGYISNTYKPIFLWTTAEDFKGFAPEPLVANSCDKALITLHEPEESYLGFYGPNQYCPLTSGGRPNLVTTPPGTAPPQTPMAAFWTKNQILATGAASLLIFGVIVNEVTKQYDIKFSFDF
jgi:hypothetical protein